MHELQKADSKEAVRLAEGTIAAVFGVRELVACVYLGAIAHAMQITKAWRKLALCEVQAHLCKVSTRFGLPLDSRPTVNRSTVACKRRPFRTLFTLWSVETGDEPVRTQQPPRGSLYLGLFPR